MKSAKDIYEQAGRIVNALACKGFTGDKPNDYWPESIKEMERIREIALRYVGNISSYFGDGEGYLKNEHYEIKLPKEIYSK